MAHPRSAAPPPGRRSGIRAGARTRAQAGVQPRAAGGRPFPRRRQGGPTPAAERNRAAAGAIPRAGRAGAPASAPPPSPSLSPAPSRVLVLVLAPALVLLAGGCGAAPGTGAAEADAPAPNLVLVVIDTLRADRLGILGHPWGTTPRTLTPHLDHLALRSAVFTQARAQAPCTFPSVNSLLTSRSPWAFSGRPPGHLGIPRGIPTLAERLRETGYRTAAVSASPVVRDTPGDLNREGGFGRGFDLFLEGCTWQEGLCVGRRAADLVKLLPEPFFLYLHFLDPHDPYAAPEGPGRRRLASGPVPADPAVAAGDPRPAAERLRDTGDAGLDGAELAWLRARYDEEVAWVDRRLGQTLEVLEEHGLLERSVLVVTADHGESFLEHGQLRHCRSLHDEELRVPLLVRLPGDDRDAAARARRVEVPVALLDVAPTLLEYAGAAGEERAGMEGSSLRRWIEGETAAGEEVAARPVLSTAGTERSLVVGRWKLIHDLAAGAEERPGAASGTASGAASEGGASRLYDLRADPGERHDLAAERPEVVARLRSGLDRRLAATEGEGLEASDRRLQRSRETERSLRALGYLQ